MRTLIAALALAALPPVMPAVVVAPFEAPVDTYAAGHRGVDLAAGPGQTVRSPIDGVILFAGRVGGKDVVSIGDQHRVASLEPVTSALTAGTPVRRGAAIGIVGAGGHCTLRCVHFGMRVDGVYVAPLRMRAVLAP